LSLVLRTEIFGKELYNAGALERIIFLVSTLTGDDAISLSSYFLFSFILFINSSSDILPSDLSFFAYSIREVMSSNCSLISVSNVLSVCGIFFLFHNNFIFCFLLVKKYFQEDFIRLSTINTSNE
jgi:hypothetical protein